MAELAVKSALAHTDAFSKDVKKSLASNTLKSRDTEQNISSPIFERVGIMQCTYGRVISEIPKPLDLLVIGMPTISRHSHPLPSRRPFVRHSGDFLAKSSVGERLPFALPTVDDDRRNCISSACARFSHFPLGHFARIAKKTSTVDLQVEDKSIQRSVLCNSEYDIA